MENQTKPNSSPRTLTQALVGLLNPIPLTGFIILISVIILIGTSLFGLDKGKILDKLSDIQYARGLITYLFAIVTIGVLIILILSALLGEGDAKERFGQAKEILSLLIGIFGTIIGFYFGSQIAVGQKAPEESIKIITPLIPDTLASGGKTTLITHVIGGKPPYHYSIGVGISSVSTYDKNTQGWIREEVDVPRVNRDSTTTVNINVKDENGDTATSRKNVFLKKFFKN